jgi:hypothetical protein
MSDDPKAPQEQRKKEPVRLDCLSPSEDRQRNELESTRAFFGSVLAFVFSPVVAAFWIVNRIPNSTPTGPLITQPSLRAPLIATMAAVAFLGGIAVFQYWRYNSMGFGKGALLGIGAGLALAAMSLMAGGC